MGMVSMDPHPSDPPGAEKQAMQSSLSRPYTNHLLSSLGPSGFRGLNILDLGCGPELRDLGEIAQLGASCCLGIDMYDPPSELRLRTKVQFIRADIDDYSLPLTDGSIDLVLLHNVFEHLHNPLRVLEEAGRVLRPGGRLSMITENHASLKNRIRLLLGGSVHFPLDRFLSSEDRIVKGGRAVFTGHIREYTSSELRHIVFRAGLRVESLVMHPATSKSGRDFDKLSGSRADSVTRLSESRFLFSLYHMAEAAVPSWRYMVTVIAAKD